MISAKVTQTLLQHLNVRKSTGSDGFSGCILKEVAVEIAEPLTKLYNICLQSGCIPLEWKQCNVTAVYKSGPDQDPSNCRLISVVPIIAKTLEKIVVNQVNRFFESNRFFELLSGCVSAGKIY